MLSRNLYKVKKSPLSGRRKQVLITGVVLVCVFTIAYSVYAMTNFKKAASKSAVAASIETGDRPLKQTTSIYVNADGGLSLRENHDSASKRLVLIPNGTKLDSSEELDGWYHVTYQGKDGWVAKQYTTTNAPAADPAATWQLYTSTSGYKIKYQPGWKAQDYGANDTQKASSLVAFSNQDLSATIPSGSEFIAPITVSVSTKSVDDANKTYSTIAGVTTETITVAGVPSQKYTYTSPTTNTQMTAVVTAVGGKVFVFTDGGGYADDLLKMLNTFTIG